MLTGVTIGIVPTDTPTIRFSHTMADVGSAGPRIIEFGIKRDQPSSVESKLEVPDRSVGRQGRATISK
jgi:hypothetical protein